MYKVMIVDDESIIRRGIRNCIPWTQHDMEIVAEAADGQEALSLAAGVNPDIVITDICMSEIDGLEMCEQLLRVNPEIKVVILTGHDEFEYAQRAVRLGVVDYVMKPTNAGDLLAVLERTKQLIGSERGSKIKLAELESKLTEHLPLIRENYLIRLISGVYTPEEIKKGEKILNLESEAGYFQVAILNYNAAAAASEFAGHMEILHFGVKNFCNEFVDLKNLGWTFYNERGQITLLLFVPHHVPNPSRHAFELLDTIQRTVNKAFQVSFSVGVGRCYPALREIKKSYAEAQEALEYRFIIGDNSLIFSDDIGKGTFHAWDELIRIEKDIISGINRGNAEMVFTLIDHYFDKLTKQSHISPLWAKAKCYELAGNVILAFSDTELWPKTFQAGGDHLYSEIYRCCSLPKAVELIKDFIHKVLEEVSDSRSSRMRKLVELGKEYINRHYPEEISVAEIAEHLYVTPNYFSRVFKKEAGESCIEYINQVRLEKAKQLLTTSLLLTYEIADTVGFRDANYFSIVFKKYTGFSPTEYRDNF